MLKVIILLVLLCTFSFSRASWSGGFVAGQKVETPSGELPIELINKKTKITVFQNGNSFAEKGKPPQVVPEKTYGVVELSDMTSLALTAETQLYLVDLKRWKQAKDLKVGDAVEKGQAEDIEKVTVTSVSTFNDDIRTATIYLLHHKAYFVNQILVK